MDSSGYGWMVETESLPGLPKERDERSLLGECADRGGGDDSSTRAIERTSCVRRYLEERLILADCLPR